MRWSINTRVVQKIGFLEQNRFLLRFGLEMSQFAANVNSGEQEKKPFVRKPAEKSTATPLEHEERAKKHLVRRKHEKKEKPKKKLVKGGLNKSEEKQCSQLMKQLMDNQYLLTSSYMKNGKAILLVISFPRVLHIYRILLHNIDIITCPFVSIYRSLLAIRRLLCCW